MSEPLSLTVIDHAKDRVHAFDHRKRPKSCHHSDVRIELREAKGGYARNGTATSLRGFGLYTDPINRLGPGDFACTVVGGSYRIEDVQLAQPLKPNAVRIHDHFIHLFQHIIGASQEAHARVVGGGGCSRPGTGCSTGAR